MKPLFKLSTAAALSFAIAPLSAQDTAEDNAAESSPAGLSSNTIVVTAQRSGAPMWTIDTASGTIILVGEIAAVPKSTPWQPDRLKEASAGASRVIIRAQPKVSPGDVFRLIFKGGSFTKLPDKTVSSDYLDSTQLARLSALETKYDKDYARGSFLMTGFDLLARRLDFDDETVKDATEIVHKAAKKADVPVQRPARLKGKDLLDDLANAQPASHIPCLTAAMTATEIGPDLIELRGDDWRKFDVPAVMANPLEIALSQCWPWADAELGEEIRSSWVAMIEASVPAEGVTLAVLPLRVLAEDKGVLDQLEARGFDIAGPEWKPSEGE